MYDINDYIFDLSLIGEYNYSQHHSDLLTYEECQEIEDYFNINENFPDMNNNYEEKSELDNIMEDIISYAIEAYNDNIFDEDDMIETFFELCLYDNVDASRLLDEPLLLYIEKDEDKKELTDEEKAKKKEKLKKTIKTAGKVALGTAAIGGAAYLYNKHANKVNNQKLETIDKRMDKVQSEISSKKSDFDLEKRKLHASLNRAKAKKEEEIVNDFQNKIDSVVSSNKAKAAKIKKSTKYSDEHKSKAIKKLAEENKETLTNLHKQRKEKLDTLHNTTFKKMDNSFNVKLADIRKNEANEVDSLNKNLDNLKELKDKYKNIGFVDKVKNAATHDKKKIKKIFGTAKTVKHPISSAKKVLNSLK